MEGLTIFEDLILERKDGAEMQLPLERIGLPDSLFGGSVFYRALFAGRKRDPIASRK